MSDNPYDQFDSEAPQAKLPPGTVSGHGGRWQDAPLPQDPWAGFQAAPAEQSGSDPWAEFKPAPGGTGSWASAPLANPYDQFDSPGGQQGSLPLIPDDGSNWASQPSGKSRRDHIS